MAEYSYDFPLRLIRAVTRRKGERLQKMPASPLAVHGPSKRWQSRRDSQENGHDHVRIAAARVVGFTQQGPLRIEPIRPLRHTFPVNRLPSIGGARESEFTGNLGNEEYRFWIGDPYVMSLRSTCRACGGVVFGALERELHKLTGKDCCSILTEVYSTLLKDGNCVVCDVRCWTAKWGVPMCRKCEPAWKFNVRAYSGIHHEAELIRARMRLWQEKNKQTQQPMDVLPY